MIVCNNVDGLGGVQRWAHDMAGLLAGRGHRVTLVGVTRSAAAHDHAGSATAAGGRPYAVETLHESWPLPALRRRPRTLRARFDLRARLLDRRRSATMREGAARLAALLDGVRAGGVVIVAQVWAMEWVRLADPGARAGLRVVGMTHESYEASGRSSRYARVKELYAGADWLLALTAEDADAWARDGLTNADHMPNPLLAVPARGAVPREPVIACLGRLSHEKGVDMAIEAWASVAARHPRWRLRLYGAGPRERALREQAERLGAAGAVEFAGVTRDVPDALARASIFALPSRQEGFPMALLEAMAAGLPAVAFDCAPGVRDLITDGADGLLARPGDTAGFAAALHRLIMDPELRERLGGAAPRSARRFDADTVLDRWERLFDLLHRGPPRTLTTLPPPAPAVPDRPAAAAAPAAPVAPAVRGAGTDAMDSVRRSRLDL
ncbi:glycosyltransferase [Spirillospora sp. CA-255316]